MQQAEDEASARLKSSGVLHLPRRAHHGRGLGAETARLGAVSAMSTRSLCVSYS